MATQLQTYATLAEYNTARANRTLVCPNVSKITDTGDIKFLRVNPQSGVGIKALVNGVANYFTLAEWNALETKPAAADIIGEYVYVDGHGFVIGQNISMNLAWSSSVVVVPGCFISAVRASAMQDMAGLENTLAIITAKTIGQIADCPAADWARSQFNGAGWMPSLGEFELIRINAADINLCRQAITAAGQARANIIFSNIYFWSSSQCNGPNAWFWYRGSWDANRKSETTQSLALSAL